ncbi:hypothetical protein AB0M19_11945 [Streptomyces sp. NPDC051920]|uniref:hypothetical protein n=1 Tax=Streptomyces sp. NPDC051920 TaxID=3155523 RepID=UPI00341D98B6
MSAPLLLAAPAIARAIGLSGARREIIWVFGVMALLAAVLAPAAGLVVAQVRGRRRARGRFLVMATVSGGLVLPLLLFAVLLPECPDGYHC